jgi:transcriptional regulator with XRE-family HTH domain
MSPGPYRRAAPETVVAVLRRTWIEIGRQLRDARLQKKLSVRVLAEKAGLAPSVVYLLEAGESASLESAIRISAALGLRLEFDLVDPRRRVEQHVRSGDLVHSLMGEAEARHMRGLEYPVGIDEPYQHYQFAGRADLISWDVASRALLHIENRTRFPDMQDMAGSFNAKRAYLGAAIAARVGLKRWASETHVIAALWSAEVLHALRLRPESFRSLSPDPAEAFAGWWAGQPPTTGVTAAIVLFDPMAAGKQRQFAGLDEALATAKPRHRGYADLVSKLRDAA